MRREIRYAGSVACCKDRTELNSVKICTLTPFSHFLGCNGSLSILPDLAYSSGIKKGWGRRYRRAPPRAQSCRSSLSPQG
jgi:hypothetical protein